MTNIDLDAAINDNVSFSATLRHDFAFGEAAGPGVHPAPWVQEAYASVGDLGSASGVLAGWSLDVGRMNNPDYGRIINSDDWDQGTPPASSDGYHLASSMSGIGIDLYYFGRGHTDGDIFVVFRAARAMHSGDMFARRGLPFLDVPNSNGSAVEFGETLKRAISGISNVDTVIPGHNPVPLPWNDFVKYEGFYNDLVMKAQQGKAAGRSVDDVVSSYRVPNEYSNYAAPEDRVRATVQYLFDGQ